MSNKTTAEICAELARHLGDLELRVGVERAVLTYAVVDLAAKGMLSSGFFDAVRKLPIPSSLPSQDAERFSQLLNERIDMLASAASKLTIKER